MCFHVFVSAFPRAFRLRLQVFFVLGVFQVFYVFSCVLGDVVFSCFQVVFQFVYSRGIQVFPRSIQVFSCVLGGVPGVFILLSGGTRCFHVKLLF